MPTFHNRFTPHATRATVYQLRADVICRGSMEAALAQVIDLILPFVAKSMYANLPPEAEAHRGFEISNDGRLCECVAFFRDFAANNLKMPNIFNNVVKSALTLVLFVAENAARLCFVLTTPAPTTKNVKKFSNTLEF